MNLPSVKDLSVANKRVLVRGDLDIPANDAWRLQTLKPTLFHLIKNDAKIVLIGHRGRPNGEISGEFSLVPVSQRLSRMIKKEIKFVYDIAGVESEDEIGKMRPGELVMLENLRFDRREQENDPEFAKKLARLGEIYVNESFADSHREHASMVALPRELKSKYKNSVAAGFHFIKEVEKLGKVLGKPKHPVIVIIGGAKSDKVKCIDKLLDIADWVLIGGKLPRVVSSFCRAKDGKTCVAAAHLVSAGGDIDEASISNFSAVIAHAGTIVWNGPMGEYEKPEFQRGTREIAQAVINNKKAFKVVGGGDTVAALQSLGILDKINWVSTGGGAMLEFLAEGTLPGIEALKN